MSASLFKEIQRRAAHINSVWHRFMLTYCKLLWKFVACRLVISILLDISDKLCRSVDVSVIKTINRNQRFFCSSQPYHLMRLMLGIWFQASWALQPSQSCFWGARSDHIWAWCGCGAGEGTLIGSDLDPEDTLSNTFPKPYPALLSILL